MQAHVPCTGAPTAAAFFVTVDSNFAGVVVSYFTLNATKWPALIAPENVSADVYGLCIIDSRSSVMFRFNFSCDSNVCPVLAILSFLLFYSVCLQLLHLAFAFAVIPLVVA